MHFPNGSLMHCVMLFKVLSNRPSPRNSNPARVKKRIRMITAVVKRVESSNSNPVP